MGFECIFLGVLNLVGDADLVKLVNTIEIDTIAGVYLINWPLGSDTLVAEFSI